MKYNTVLTMCQAAYIEGVKDGMDSDPDAIVVIKEAEWPHPVFRTKFEKWWTKVTQ